MALTVWQSPEIKTNLTKEEARQIHNTLREMAAFLKKKRFYKKAQTLRVMQTIFWLPLSAESLNSSFDALKELAGE